MVYYLDIAKLEKIVKREKIMCYLDILNTKVF